MAIAFDPAHVLLLLPAEAYVEFQLFAQECRPQSFMMVMGYGECGPGYIPIDRAFEENDQNLNDWAWTPPGSAGPSTKLNGPIMRWNICCARGTPCTANAVR